MIIDATATARRRDRRAHTFEQILSAPRRARVAWQNGVVVNRSSRHSPMMQRVVLLGAMLLVVMMIASVAFA